MMANRYVPEAYTPSNYLWGMLLWCKRRQSRYHCCPNCSECGWDCSQKDKIDQITTNGKLDIAKLLTNVSNGSFAMGYTNSYQSSTGLNFLLNVLNAFAQGDESQMLSRCC